MQRDVFTIDRKERFDDVGEQDEAGDVEYAYRGYNYVVATEGQVFGCCTYDDEPGVAIVVSPPNAHEMQSAKPLVSFLLNALGVSSVKFYDAENGVYRGVDPETLDFHG